jgi:hypothetical protein
MCHPLHIQQLIVRKEIRPAGTTRTLRQLGHMAHALWGISPNQAAGPSNYRLATQCSAITYPRVSILRVPEERAWMWWEL